MTPLALAMVQIIAQYGIPLAEQLYTKWATGANPTAQDFTDLRTLAQDNGVSAMTAELAKLNIDPKSPQGVALLALVQ